MSAFHCRRVLFWIRRLLFDAMKVVLHQTTQLETVTMALLAFAVAQGTWTMRMPSISKHGWKCPHRREETGEALLKMQERAPRHWEQVTERRMGKKELD
jgi:hypothetical protein